MLGMIREFLNQLLSGLLFVWVGGPLWVKDYLLSELSWNVYLVREWFDQCDAELILTIPSSRQTVPDRLVWHYDAKGVVQTLHMEHGSVCDWLAPCLGNLTKKNASLFLILVWFVWKERNKRLWNGRFASLDQLAFQVTSFYHLHMSVQAPSRRVVGRRNSQWTPPCPGWLKANCDGIYDASSHSVGIGVVVRDSSGSIVGVVCSKVRWVSNPQTIEALAYRAACSLLDRFGLAPVAFESDCQHAVTTINSQGVNTSLLGRVYEDISTMLGSLRGSYLSYISWNANKVANLLDLH
ncbi:putative ribonuclease H-like domain-containing protein [Rosa chinensis]|uniref:Putative ribonuclease H-like domain-containing protein n=1 Tax=Rosa chinensis TaxID=74649 RepID=A0A2P6PBX7_ROSCH|nr:putative ribonuclease H-like domain-containing protein [Rosa chinensis]